jgi:hypothetical protein
MITILVIETTFKDHIYKKNLANHLNIILHKHNLRKHDVILILHGSKNILTSWNTTF